MLIKEAQPSWSRSGGLYGMACLDKLSLLKYISTWTVTGWHWENFHSTHFLLDLFNDSSKSNVITLPLLGIALRPHCRGGKELHHNQRTQPRLLKHRGWAAADGGEKEPFLQRRSWSRVSLSLDTDSLSGKTTPRIRNHFFASLLLYLSNKGGPALPENESTHAWQEWTSSPSSAKSSSSVNVPNKNYNRQKKKKNRECWASKAGDGATFLPFTSLIVCNFSAS